MIESLRNVPTCFGCEQCSYYTTAYKPVCPYCGNTAMHPIESLATGEIVDFVPVLYPPDNLKRLEGYVSVLVRLDNGCNVFGMIQGNPESITIGRKVVISKYDETTHELLFLRN